jgi:hypothetical protein
MSFDHVTFPAVDAALRMKERTLLQFRRAEVFQAVLRAMAVELQTLLDAIKTTQEKRTCSEAIGESLEALGRIVGMTRVIFDYGYYNWFTPDEVDYPPDISMAWVTGSALGELQPVDDGTFRNLLEFKIFRNFSQYGSIPEIETAILLAFGVRVGFQFADDPMDVYIVLPDVTPHHIVQFLTQLKYNQQVEGIYYPPYPMTWRILGTRSLDSFVLTTDDGEFLETDTGEYITIDGGHTGGLPSANIYHLLIEDDSEFLTESGNNIDIEH